MKNIANFHASKIYFKDVVIQYLNWLKKNLPVIIIPIIFGVVFTFIHNQIIVVDIGVEFVCSIILSSLIKLLIVTFLIMKYKKIQVSDLFSPAKLIQLFIILLIFSAYAGIGNLLFIYKVINSPTILQIFNALGLVLLSISIFFALNSEKRFGFVDSIRFLFGNLNFYAQFALVFFLCTFLFLFLAGFVIKIITAAFLPLYMFSILAVIIYTIIVPISFIYIDLKLSKESASL